MNNFTPEQISYLKWIRDTMPRFYADVVQPHLANNGLGSIGSVAGLSGFEDILTSITDALPKLGQTYADYATAQAALNQKTQQVIATTRANSAVNYLPWILGAGAGLALLLFATR